MDKLTPLRALIIEDWEDDVLLLHHTIQRAGFELEYVNVATKESLSAALTQSWDIVFSDYSMPAFNGHEALAMVRQADPDVPFIFVSGTMGEDLAVEAMRLGAQDYFFKGNFTRLASAITREMRERVNRRAHREAQERIHYLANYDNLTGLPNRALFTERLFKSIETARQSGTGFAVFILDLDCFRDINDHLGMAVGDQLLIQIGKRLVATDQPPDTVARLSADEFGIIVNDLADDHAAAIAAETILCAFARPFSLARYEWQVHASMGSCLFPGCGDSVEQLVSFALLALHHAQQTTGSSYLSYAETMSSALEEKLSLRRALEQALDQKEFRVHYQPQVSLTDGRLAGIEALLRWDRPGYGPVGPNVFIPIAESSGLIVLLGDWVLREVCRQIAAWRDAGLPKVRVAVNFSAYQFRRSDMVPTVRAILLEFDLPPSSLEIEITETALMQDAAAATAILTELRELGVKIALDDFGTGYSSLSYLKRFPVDVLKIDREFIRDLPHDKDDAAIVHAIIAMADKLGLEVVAEGVETEQQFEFLKQANCGISQGYYFLPPVTAEALLPVLTGSAEFGVRVNKR